MLFFKDFVLYESNDNLTIDTQAITASLGNWFKEYNDAKNASHENDKLYVLTYGEDFNAGTREKYLMNIQQGEASIEISIDETYVKNIKQYNSGKIQCAIIEENTNNEKTGSLKNGLKLPEGYKIVAELPQTLTNWGDPTQLVGKKLLITYNFADKQMSAKIDGITQLQKQDGNNSGNDNITPVVNIPIAGIEQSAKNVKETPSTGNAENTTPSENTQGNVLKVPNAGELQQEEK